MVSSGIIGMARMARKLSNVGDMIDVCTSINLLYVNICGFAWLMAILLWWLFEYYYCIFVYDYCSTACSYFYYNDIIVLI